MWSFLVLFSSCVVLCAGDDPAELDAAIYGHIFDGVNPNLDITTECAPNEEFSCVTSCPPEKTCEDRENYECLEDVEVCGYKCVCKEGFYRNATGECITEALCDQCPGVNEYYACGAPCDNVCATLDIQNKTSCPEEFLECKPMCYCDDGYARDELGNCILIEECQCEPNEVFSCVNSCPPEKTCGYHDQISCPDVFEDCYLKCVCKEGFIRTSHGTCIAEQQCGAECGSNEEFSCVTSCPPEKTCEDRENYECLQDVEDCGYKCVCKEGFYRNATGECITEALCEKCPGANEHYACGGPCDNVCATLHLQNKTSCGQDASESGCQPSCYCNDGFARNKSGHCIPFEECPPLGCGKNEVKTDCKYSCPTTDFIYPGLNSEPCQECEPGCECESGYERKDTNVPDSPCILTSV